MSEFSNLDVEELRIYKYYLIGQIQELQKNFATNELLNVEFALI